VDHYYRELAAAFVRGRLGDGPGDDDALIRRGREAGLDLHKFKRSAELSRVRKVIGVLRSIAPERLLDVGSGRGTFLWPLVDAFPSLAVVAVDKSARRAADLGAVARGGVTRLRSLRMNAQALAFAGASFDAVTLLEVLEHLDDPVRAAAEALRVARGFVVASVPSKPDDNPEHIHLFDAPALERLFAGAARVQCEYVLNHIVMVARV
jgi:ubiquinone/menaquinone biosynthesis C-methylase UbiE